MQVETIKEFVFQRNKFHGTDYLVHTIAFHVAPVLEGAKPSVVLTFKKCKRNLCNLWNDYKNNFLNRNTLEFLEIKSNENQVTVLFYNSEVLSRIISTPSNMRLLKLYGYRKNASLEETLLYLKKRFGHDFPHEIGVFLGIPLKDTISFIQHKGQNFIFNGDWKVYHNLEEAYATFAMFEKARKEFLTFIKKGRRPIDYLLEKAA